MDLDVLVRHDLLTFLKNDCETRGTTILCKTMIVALVQMLCTNDFEIFQTQRTSSMASTPSQLT